MEWLLIPIRKELPANEDEMEDFEAVKKAADYLKDGKRVFIHCLDGRRKTALAAYLVLRQLGKKSNEAVELIKKCRMKTAEHLNSDDRKWADEFLFSNNPQS
jgi:protein-tyrosine phosphatase